ncbi:retrotransposon protein, putative, ty1-copia subclass [Tanacetum coccineum]|uniref:Retrotransposon protein, putative, ty1-copia subclass n=1 Tax=Tanacetum coccineum TaxID=301880 RepID=A0ABQ4XPC1_9ASTR
MTGYAILSELENPTVTAGGLGDPRYIWGPPDLSGSRPLNDAQNEVACLMLSSMSPELQRTLENYKAYDKIQELKTMFEEQAKHELFEIVKAFHACKQEDGQSVSSYLLKMKSYLDTLERLGYAMPKERVSLILNSLNKDYDQFVQNYNICSMGKMLARLHAMLKLHEKGIPKKAETPVVLAIREGKIQKDMKKSQGAKGEAKGKNKLAYAPKPRSHRHLREIIWHSTLSATTARRLVTGGGVFCPTMLNNVFYFNAIPRDGLYEIDMHTRYPNVSYNYNVSNKRAKHGLYSYYLWHYRLGHIKKKHMDMLQCDRLLQLTHDESHEKCKSCISRKMACKTFPHQVERAKDLLGLIHTDVCGPFRTVSREGANYFITFTDDLAVMNEVENQLGKKLKAIRSDQGGEYLSHEFAIHMKSFMIQEASGSHGLLEMSGSDKGLEIIQEEDTQPLENTSKEHNEVAPIEVESQNVRVLIRRSARIPQAPDRYGYYVDVEEYVLGDLDEPPNYKAASADPKFDKWLEAINTEMQSIKDNQVWILVELPPNGRIVRNIRAIRILLAITTFYNYEIWQMDVKTTFLNGHLSEDVYMVQTEGFVDSKHPNKVCKLQCSIYGLKQASRSWNKRFDEKIKKIGFAQNPDEPCVYLKASRSNFAFLVLYVDDILLMV